MKDQDYLSDEDKITESKSIILGPDETDPLVETVSIGPTREDPAGVHSYSIGGLLVQYKDLESKHEQLNEKYKAVCEEMEDMQIWLDYVVP